MLAGCAPLGGVVGLRTRVEPPPSGRFDGHVVKTQLLYWISQRVRSRLHLTLTEKQKLQRE
eukprot:5859536-Prymnesium_polylepis.1